MVITSNDIIREFSRCNFKHVNDTVEPLGPLTEEYCLAVVEMVQERDNLKQKVKDAYEVLEAIAGKVDDRGTQRFILAAMDKIKR